MRILAFSDLHSSRSHADRIVQASQDADLVLGAGDFCNMRRGLAEAMDHLSQLSAPCIVVPGNAESADELQKAALPGMIVLHGEGINHGSLRIFGLGYGVPTTPFGSWSCDLSEGQAHEMLSACAAADILLLHSPPKGVADVTSMGVSVGSTAIRDAIQRLQPRLALCGHIHDSWGKTGRIGTTHVANLGPTANWFDIDPLS